MRSRSSELETPSLFALESHGHVRINVPRLVARAERACVGEPIRRRDIEDLCKPAVRVKDQRSRAGILF